MSKRFFRIKIFLRGQNKAANMTAPVLHGALAAREESIIMIMDRIALSLAIIGGINWGSVGLFRFDLVAWLFGGQTATVSRVIYTLVGLSAIWCISLLFRSDAVTDE